MGKKSRRAKAKKSDFQKVKLKVGKKRPLPSNVTEVAFKSQSIYIPDQMKNVKLEEEEIEEEIVGKKNIPELLGQVGHFNTNFRTDALTSLRVHLSNNRNLIQNHLPKIFEKVLRTMADEDQQVRKSSLSFFRLIFAEISEQEMSPFFDIILSHLYCAMSHIHDDVQRDSLQVVDLVIEHFPGLLSESHRNSLLQHFIELISTKQTTSAASGKAKNKGVVGTTRILSMKLSNKESSISWRNRILSRLHQLLTTSESPKNTENTKNHPKYLENLIKNKKIRFNEENGAMIQWNSDDISSVLTGFESQKLLKPAFSLRSISMNTLSSFTPEDTTTTPWQLITTIFPLLFDCWHEAVSDESKSLNYESVTTMNLTLNIMNLLCKKLMETADNKMAAIANVRSTYMKYFDQYFYSNFPYHHTGGRQSTKKKKTDENVKQVTTADIQSINLSICQLVSSLTADIYLSDDGQMLSSVATFVSMLLMSAGGSRGSFVDYKALDQCISCTKSLLDISADQATIENLLQPLLIFYQHMNGNSKDKTTLLKFFLELYSDEKKNFISDAPTMTEWLCSLPDLLMTILHNKARNSKSAARKDESCINSQSGHLHLLISCMRLACLRKSEEFQRQMESQISHILEILKLNLNQIFCSSPELSDQVGKGFSCDVCSDLQARLFEVLIYNSSFLIEQNVTMLSHICHQLQISPKIVCYITQMFILQFRKSSNPEKFVLMMKFICSILLGISREELSVIQSTSVSEDCDTTIKIMGMDCDVINEFERQKIIVDKLCELLPTIDHMSQLIQHFICDKIMSKYNTLPIKSTYAILKVGSMILRLGKLEALQSQGLVNVLGKLTASTLMEMYNVTETNKNSYIVKIMSTFVNVLFQNNDVLMKCVELIGKLDFADVTVCQTVCALMNDLMLNVGLHEKLLLNQKTLNNLMENMKKSCEDITSTKWFKSTNNNFHVLLQNKS
uniref:testis-expressed protein 10 homolog n=1 Tax=Styela clava TaxID=7725 RepID=UPI001939CE5A|nr:testis-expressed protein 10 homolog [Styela clava]